jgi:hypothetical protein
MARVSLFTPAQALEISFNGDQRDIDVPTGQGREVASTHKLTHLNVTDAEHLGGFVRVGCKLACGCSHLSPCETA